MAESRALGDEEKALDVEVERIEAEVRDLLLRTPNLPADDCPDGAGEADNVVLRVEGYDPDSYAAHQRVPHWDIGTELGILDGERAAKISGSMFTMYRGWGARLLRAMIQLSLDRNADAYEEIRPPTLVRTDTMISTGHLPKFEEEAYHMERDDLWAIPTAEVPLTSLHRDEVLDEADLPLRYTAHTSCFRREAGAAGRDTRGLLRVHEFDKVELLAVAPRHRRGRQVPGGRARPQRVASSRDLGLAYRVVDLCTGDIGASAARTWDIEAYAPGCDMWLEVSSVSWFSRLPGPAGQHPLPHRRQQGHRGLPHGERLGDGVATHRGGLPRDPPSARRVDRGRRVPALATSAASRPSRAAADRGVACGDRNGTAARGGHGMQKFWSWLAVNLGKRAGVVSIVGLLITVVLGLRHHQARVRHRPGQLPQQGRGGLQGQRRLPGPLRRAGHAHARQRGRGHTSSTCSPRRTSPQWTAIDAEILRRAATSSSGSSRRSPPCSSPTTSCCPTPATSSTAWPPRSSSGDRAATRSPEGKAARSASSGKTLERVNAIPAESRVIGNPAWIDFLLHDNEGEIRKSLRPFFPDEQHAQMVVRLPGNEDIEEEGKAADFVQEATADLDVRGRRVDHHRRPGAAPRHQRLPDAAACSRSAPSPSGSWS